MSDPAYCTRQDIEQHFSPAAVIAWADQDGSGVLEHSNADNLDEYATIDDAINEASQEIELYARQHYSPAGLAKSSLIKRWCVWLSAYYLSSTRANPVPQAILRNYEDILNKLEKIRAGLFKLPGIALRADMRPSWSNLRVDRRYVQSKIRVQQETSSSAPSVLPVHVDDEIPQQYL